MCRTLLLPWHPREGLARPAQPSNPDPPRGPSLLLRGCEQLRKWSSLSKPLLLFSFQDIPAQGGEVCGKTESTELKHQGLRRLRATCKGELKHDYDPHTSPSPNPLFQGHWQVHFREASHLAQSDVCVE